MRLSDIDPAKCAEQAVTELLTRVQSVTHLGPGIEVTAISRTGKKPRPASSSDWASTGIGLATHAVAVYAITGQEPDDAPIGDYLQTITEARDRRVQPWERGARDPVREIDVVLCAAVGRLALAALEPISTRCLAALAGLRKQSIKQMASRGDGPPIHDGWVPYRQAREWLSGRGVPGL